MTNLKELELFNNTKNLQNTVTINLVKPTVKVNSNNCRIQSSKLKSLVNIFENETQKTQNFMKSENTKRNFMTTTTNKQMAGNCLENEMQQQKQLQQQQQHKEYHSLPQDLTERLIETEPNTTITTTTAQASPTEEEENSELIKQENKTINNDTEHENENHRSINNEEQQEHHPLHEFSRKDHNSDSDSALSSAPPSISPQPPPADMQTNDIWQTIRSYTRDIENLQKEVDSLQKENEHLRTELNVAKDHILESEKTAMEATKNNKKLKSFMDRIQFLEEQERELTSECNDLREQNELLEFRILELEESSDKWSLPCQNAASTANNSAAPSVGATQSQNVWNFSAAGNDELCSGPFESATENISQQLNEMLEDLSLKDEHKQCLQQVLVLLEKQSEKNLLMSQRTTSSSNSSGPNSFTTNSSSDETNSLEMVKSRVSDYSSASSASSAASTASCSTHPIFETLNSSLKSIKSPATNSRIVATVPPYNSTHPLHIAPHNTPNESPRKNRSCVGTPPANNTSSTTSSWQSNSLTESGVFVESDFYSDNACTQTDFEEDEEAGVEDSQARAPNTTEQQKQKQNKVPATSIPASAVTQALQAQQQKQQQQQQQQNADQKRLQYYQERLRLLESKLLVYESSGDLQAKRLADRLQREIQLEKELNELRDRVEYLIGENASLEEEKCEFEEAENDTRLRLQRLEIELEILSQRNVELELSKEALSAKYKDCRSECLILRDDLSAIETQLRNLDEDKRKAKENLEFLHSLLPLLVAYNIAIGGAGGDSCCDVLEELTEKPALEVYGMGNTLEGASNPITSGACAVGASAMGAMGTITTPEYGRASSGAPVGFGGTNRCCCQKLEEEITCLKRQLRQLTDRYNEAMESADTHWLDLETEYKDREETARSKEACLKQKIAQLEEILRADSYAANEKIMQMEETEKELTCVLKRLSRENQCIAADHQSLTKEYECCREENQRLCENMKTLNEALEEEKKRCKVLKNELCLLQKCHQNAEKRSCVELKTLRAENQALRNEFQNSEITNCELREEVKTLEEQIDKLHCRGKCLQKKICELRDEIRTKDEQCERLEKHLERNEGYNLAEEMESGPSKRFKRGEVGDLKSAAKGLCYALKNVKECETTVPQLNNVARDVKRLADCLLGDPVSCDSDETGPSTAIGAEVRNRPSLGCSFSEPAVKSRSPRSSRSSRSIKGERGSFGEERGSIKEERESYKEERGSREDLKEETQDEEYREEKGDEANEQISRSSRTVEEVRRSIQSIRKSVQESRKSLLGSSSAAEEFLKETGLAAESGEQAVEQDADQIADQPAADQPTDELERTEGGYDLGARSPRSSRFRNITIGMALVPQFKITEQNIYPNVSPQNRQKKTICEVPSEMRKLDYYQPPTTSSSARPSARNTGKPMMASGTEEQYDLPPKATPSMTSGRKRTVKLRRPRRRFQYSLSWMARIKRMVTQMNSCRNMNQLDEPDYSHSEVMQRKISYDSFQSLCESQEMPDLRNDVNFAETASIKTAVFKPDMEKRSQKTDKETETEARPFTKVDSGTQVNTAEQDTERLLRIIPPQMRSFVNVLKASIEHTDAEADALNVKIAKRFETDSEFQHGLEVLCRLTMNKPRDSEAFESYESFVAGITGLKILQELFFPLQVPILKQIESQLNESLINFHTKKMGSEFYCKVYCPVKRPTAPSIGFVNKRLL